MGPELVLHPLRMRIILAIARGESATAGELAAEMPDVPPATLYRHLNALRRGGILDVSGERRVRGAIERRYALQPRAADITAADLAGASREDHLRWFAMFLAGLIGAYARYLDRGEPDLVRDGVGYREVLVHLSDDEVGPLSAALNGALQPFLARPAGEGRTPRLLATVFMPADVAVQPSAHDADPSPSDSERPS